MADSYDKNYINTLISEYYTKTQFDNALLLKSDKITTYTKTEIDNAVATKQNNVNNVPGTGERLLEVNCLKRIFAISPLQVKHI